MPDDLNPDRQRRHDANNRDQRDGASDTVRRIAKDEMAQAWSDIGVNIESWESRNEMRAVLDYMRDRHRDRERTAEANAYALKMKAKEAEVDEALSFVRNLRAKTNEVGTEARKGLVGMVMTALGGAAAATLATLLSTGHKP